MRKMIGIKNMLKRLALTIAAALFFSSAGSLSAAGNEIAKTSFDVPAGAETVLRVTLSAPGYLWKNGPWEPPLEIRVDGVLKSVLAPFRGAEPAEYSFSIGPLEAGAHEAALIDPAEAPRGVKVDSFAAEIVLPGDPDYDALRYAPVLMGRDENTNSDVPLLMWVDEKKESKGRTFAYTIVWSNEDGGTPTSELMARYGRTVDIEWIYSVRLDEAGNILSETYQGPKHETLHFKGGRRGDHAIFRTCTKNNMVCDAGESKLVFSYMPVKFAVTGARDRMLDLYPWIYRVANEELYKENKLSKTIPDIVYRVDDSKRYALVDFDTETLFPVGIEVALKLRGSDVWRTADLGVEGMLQKLSGPVRVGIWTPRGTVIEDVEAVRFRAIGGDGAWYTLRAVGELVFLDEKFRPVEKSIPWKGRKRVSAGGEPVIIKIPE